MKTEKIIRFILPLDCLTPYPAFYQLTLSVFFNKCYLTGGFLVSFIEMQGVVVIEQLLYTARRHPIDHHLSFRPRGFLGGEVIYISSISIISTSHAKLLCLLFQNLLFRGVSSITFSPESPWLEKEVSRDLKLRSTVNKRFHACLSFHFPLF